MCRQAAAGAVATAPFAAEPTPYNAATCEDRPKPMQRTSHNPIIHVVAADLREQRRTVLRRLLRTVSPAHPQHVLQVDAGPLQRISRQRVRRVRAPGPVSVLRGMALRRVIRRLSWRRLSPIVHAWTPTAARWCASLLGGAWHVLIELDSLVDLREQTFWPVSPRTDDLPLYICPTAVSRARLRQLGVPPERCAQIDPGVITEPTLVWDREALRDELLLQDDETLIVPLPPLHHATGSRLAVWASLLLRKADYNVRLLLAGEGPVRASLHHLVRSAGMDGILRRAPRSMDFDEILAAADLVTYFPSGDAPIDPVLSAMAAGCPLVTSAAPSLQQVLPDGDVSWRCTVNTVETVARTMQRAISSPDRTQQLVERAAALVAERFTIRRMTDAYADLYASLA